MAANVATGAQWNEGVIGAFAGGAVAGAIIATTGNVTAASYASAAAEAFVNQTLSYVPKVAGWNGTKRKELNCQNVTNSVLNIAADTVVNGSINMITANVAGRIVPTNPNWFKPTRLYSSFFGRYAIRSTRQTMLQSGFNAMFSIIPFKDSPENELEQSPIIKITVPTILSQGR